MSEDTLLEFPCDFPIKAMGNAGGEPEFSLYVVELIRRHCPDLGEGAVRTQDSTNGRFLSVTVSVRVSSKDQLDAIYQDLTASERVLMAL
ncbi:MAG: DUF493 domain-containing protein [Gammaproteobacteria bacterium]|nr:DUF493 domain-containing protein [Gammaproteobacteria bacterium]MCP5136635.1 DUF493 domain-containing protein [Gammaproteobacteria bacterium]